MSHGRFTDRAWTGKGVLEHSAYGLEDKGNRKVGDKEKTSPTTPFCQGQAPQAALEPGGAQVRSNLCSLSTNNEQRLWCSVRTEEI